MTHGRMGTPASRASRKAPSLKLCTSPSRLREPSGKMMTEVPRCRCSSPLDMNPERLAYRAPVVHRDVAVQPQHHPEQRPFVDAAFGHPFEVNLRQHVHQRDVHHGLVIDRHHVGAFRVDVFPSFHAEPPERVQEEDAPCPETRRRMERLPFPVERHGEREKQEHEDEVGERPRQQDEVV